MKSSNHHYTHLTSVVNLIRHYVLCNFTSLHDHAISSGDIQLSIREMQPISAVYILCNVLSVLKELPFH